MDEGTSPGFTAATRAEQAFVFLTHQPVPRILNHYARLKAETEGLLDGYLAIDHGEQAAPPGLPLHLEASRRGGGALPERLAQDALAGPPPRTTYNDLIFVPLIRQAPLSSYRFVWFVEYDVDYAGDWGAFFRRVMGCEADLLTTNVTSHALDPDWVHWRTFEMPPEVPGPERLRAFMPLARFSPRLLTAYVEGARDPRWRGHFEALIPTIAKRQGLTVEDINGRTPYDPSQRQHPYYLSPPLQPITFGVSRSQPRSYFHETPDLYPFPQKLYHPIKIDPGKP